MCLLLTGSERCNTVIDLTFIALEAATRFDCLQFHLLNLSFAFRFGTSKVVPYDIPVHLSIGLMLHLNAENWFEQAWLFYNKVNAPCVVAEKLS